MRVASAFNLPGKSSSASHGLAPAEETGRTTRRNIRKILRYLISTNLSEILLVVAGTSIGMGAPLTPMQLLWINLISDVLPGIGLAMEALEHDVLRQAPKEEDSALMPGRELGSLAAQAAIMGGAAMTAGLFGASRYGLNSAQARTMTFESLVTTQLLHAITSRSDAEGIFVPRSRPPDHALSLIIGGSMVVQTAGLFHAICEKAPREAPAGQQKSDLMVPGSRRIRP